jgi:hypothetical protein
VAFRPRHGLCLPSAVDGRRHATPDLVAARRGDESEHVRASALKEGAGVRSGQAAGARADGCHVHGRRGASCAGGCDATAVAFTERGSREAAVTVEPRLSASRARHGTGREEGEREGTRRHAADGQRSRNGKRASACEIACESAGRRREAAPNEEQAQRRRWRGGGEAAAQAEAAGLGWLSLFGSGRCWAGWVFLS